MLPVTLGHLCPAMTHSRDWDRDHASPRDSNGEWESMRNWDKAPASLPGLRLGTTPGPAATHQVRGLHWVRLPPPCLSCPVRSGPIRAVPGGRALTWALPSRAVPCRAKAERSKAGTEQARRDGTGRNGVGGSCPRTARGSPTAGIGTRSPGGRECSVNTEIWVHGGSLGTPGGTGTAGHGAREAHGCECRAGTVPPLPAAGPGGRQGIPVAGRWLPAPSLGTSGVLHVLWPLGRSAQPCCHRDGLPSAWNQNCHFPKVPAMALRLLLASRPAGQPWGLRQAQHRGSQLGEKSRAGRATALPGQL